MKINYKMLFAIPAYLLLFLLSSCVTQEINVRQMLDAKDEEKIYTAHNLWFTDPEKIESINYRKGEVIPFGTEVEVLSAILDNYSDDEKIVFKTVPEGKTYTIINRKKWRAKNESIHTFLGQYFTTRTPEELCAGRSPELLKAMREGRIEIGMTRDDVVMTLGYPARHRNPIYEQDTWIFWIAPAESERIIFKNGKVKHILRL